MLQIRDSFYYYKVGKEVADSGSYYNWCVRTNFRNIHLDLAIRLLSSTLVT